MSRQATYRLSKIALVSILLASGITSAANLAPPPFEVMDRHGVNVATGHVSPTLNDLSIGGSVGLTHSISSFTSNFVNWEGEGPLGFKDKFFGRIIKVVRFKPDPNDATAWEYALRVFADGGSVDFDINPDGTTFKAHSDPRHILEFTPGYGFVWTRPDGTQVTYRSALQSFDARAKTISDVPMLSLSEIKYPNGLTLTVHGESDTITSVTTNTGYQLKYVYMQDTSVWPGDSNQSSLVPHVQPWGFTPKYIVGINNAVEYCAPSSATIYSTSLQDACPNTTPDKWPKVTYIWPAGMPRVMYLQEASFKVEDAMGGVTEYIHRPFPTRYYVQNIGYFGDPDYNLPRIYQIKSSRSDVPNVTYDYVTNAASAGAVDFWPLFQAGPYAQLKSSRVGGDTIGYTIGANGPHQWEYINGSGGTRAISSVWAHSNHGIFKVIAWDKTIDMREDTTNRFVSAYNTFGGGSVTVDPFSGYDSRGNVIAMTENGFTKYAGYEATCPPERRKVCNQAVWTKDANGNQTDYEYDLNSGQVARVRMPADKDGIRPEIRYTYEPKYAYYKNASGAYQQATTPVYLLTKEHKCQATATTTNADGSAGCAGGAVDEIITEYDYGSAQGPNNLQLRGVTIKAYNNKTLEVRRTCYGYDDYGNRIGETKPLANLSSCY